MLLNKYFTTHYAASSQSHYLQWLYVREKYAVNLLMFWSRYFSFYIFYVYFVYDLSIKYINKGAAVVSGC